MESETTVETGEDPVVDPAPVEVPADDPPADDAPAEDDEAPAEEDE
jgi:hypothetical protein